MSTVRAAEDSTNERVCTDSVVPARGAPSGRALRRRCDRRIVGHDDPACRPRSGGQYKRTRLYQFGSSTAYGCPRPTEYLHQIGRATKNAGCAMRTCVACVCIHFAPDKIRRKQRTTDFSAEPGRMELWFYRVYIAIILLLLLLTVSQVCAYTHCGYKVTNL